MSNIIPFEFKGETFRLIDQGGGVFLAGAQVARAMGYANPADAVRTHCKHARMFNYSELLELGFEAPSRFGMLMIPEGDVMRLIARSNLPAAQEFECKVFDEILPQIRKTGGYGLPNLNDPKLLRRSSPFLSVREFPVSSKPRKGAAAQPGRSKSSP
jgi:prophage antirepressor-like protein